MQHDYNFGINTQNFLSNIQKPWIIVGHARKIYPPIDKSLYVLKNGVLSENFAIKKMKNSYTLGKFIGKKFKWNKHMPRNFYERRGNFENISLIGMTDIESSFNILPKDWENDASISNVVPNTFEVLFNFITPSTNASTFLDSFKSFAPLNSFHIVDIS